MVDRCNWTFKSCCQWFLVERNLFLVTPYIRKIILQLLNAQFLYEQALYRFNCSLNSQRFLISHNIWTLWIHIVTTKSKHWKIFGSRERIVPRRLLSCAFNLVTGCILLLKKIATALICIKEVMIWKWNKKSMQLLCVNKKVRNLIHFALFRPKSFYKFWAIKNETRDWSNSATTIVGDNGH